MKHLINSIITLPLAIVFILSPVTNAKAAPTAPGDFGAPVSVTTYEDENGCTITERLYFYSDSKTAARDKSGEGWYKNEKTYTWDGDGRVTTYYAQGYFVWGNGEVSVSNESGGISNLPDYATVSDEKTVTEYGQYALIFNHYAAAKYSCTLTTPFGLKQNLSVTIRISESGNAI